MSFTTETRKRRATAAARLLPLDDGRRDPYRTAADGTSTPGASIIRPHRWRAPRITLEDLCADWHAADETRRESIARHGRALARATGNPGGLGDLTDAA